MAVEEENKTIQSTLGTLLNIEQLKLEKEECLRYFIVGKDVMALLLSRFSKSLKFSNWLLFNSKKHG